MRNASTISQFANDANAFDTHSDAMRCGFVGGQCGYLHLSVFVCVCDAKVSREMEHHFACVCVFVSGKVMDRCALEALMRIAIPTDTMRSFGYLCACFRLCVIMHLHVW